MQSIFWLAVFVIGGLTLAYRRVDLRTTTIVVGITLGLYTLMGDGGFIWVMLLWLTFAGLVALNLDELRREHVTKRLLAMYRTMLPPMSRTEREALESGTVWWEGELFSGMPDWGKLMSMPAPRLTSEEQAFLDGPTNELCALLDDWQISHELMDMPPEVWAFIKKHRFFAMIIPKDYGGLGFTALANSMVLAKVASNLKGLPHKIRVEGHTDNVPIRSKRFPSNWELAGARAAEVVKLLAANGIDPTLLSAVSFGEYAPRASNDTPEGKAKNRRINITLQPEVDAAPADEGVPAESAGSS